MDHLQIITMTNNVIQLISGIITDKTAIIIGVADICCLLKKLTENYDESHDINHHIEVFKNSINILKKLNLDKLIKSSQYNRLIILITYVSLLHDTIDPKYQDSLQDKINELNFFLDNKCPNESENIKWIINNMSYSKEKKYGYPCHSDMIVMLSRDIVSDADKLEALGEIGLKRCEQYTIATHPNLQQDEINKLVVEHCHDKLLKLKDFYIRTYPGKEMANPRHDVIVKKLNL